MRVWITVLMLALGPSAFAQEEPDMSRAVELYENGARLYEEGLYEDAIVAWEASYEISKEPALYYNIANAQERIGNLPAALEALQKFRPFAEADQREVLARRIYALERRVDAQKDQERQIREAAEKAAADKLAAEQAASVPVAPTSPPEEPRGDKKRTWILPAVGAGLVVVGGAVAGGTYAQGQGFRNDGDQAGYDRVRPINNAGLVAAGLGAVTVGVGLAVPLGGPSPRLRGAR